MIYCLVQSSAAHPDLARGIPPEGLLNAAEQRQFYALRSLKRQREWLLGRWTAKRLLQMVVEQQNGRRVPLDTFTIYNVANGAPHLTSVYLPGATLSISHRDDRGLCAVSTGGEGCGDEQTECLGIDIERIEPRTGSFAEDYFTEPEIQCVRRAPDSIADLLITGIWSAKESALKALRVGLTVDTRAVTCLLQAPGAPLHNWTRFDIMCDQARLKRSAAPLKGWWRTMEDYVLTCVGSSEPLWMSQALRMMRLEVAA